MENDNFFLKGEYRVRVIDQNGKTKHDCVYKNIIVKAGRSAIISRIGNATPTYDLLAEYIAVGTGTNAPADTDTTLQTETARKAVLSRSTSDDVGAISTTFNAGDIPTSTLKEIGLFIDSTATATADTGVLLSRVAVDLAVTALDSVFIDYRITCSDA